MKNKYEEIIKSSVEVTEVSQEKTFAAIERGMSQALQEDAKIKKMRRRKILIAPAILVAAIAMIFAAGMTNVGVAKVLADVPFIGNFFAIYSVPRQAASNTAQPLTIDVNPSITYTAYSEAKNDTNESTYYIQPGYYDIKVLGDQPAQIFGARLEPGQVYHNYFLEQQNVIEFGDYAGKLEFTPATFTKLSLENNQYILKNVTGQYAVGDEIEAGTYRAEVTSTASVWGVFLGNSEALENGDLQSAGRWFASNIGPDAQEISLAAGESFDIENLAEIGQVGSEEILKTLPGDYTITLTKLD